VFVLEAAELSTNSEREGAVELRHPVTQNSFSYAGTKNNSKGGK
jgi:hypothetical protein